MVTTTHRNVRRAHALSAGAASRLLALLAALPVPVAEARARITRASCHALEDQFGPERAVLRAPMAALPGINLDRLRALTTHATADLGYPLAAVIAAEEEEERQRRRARAAALRVGGLRRLLDAKRLRAATIGHMVESLAIFEVLPVHPADFDLMLAEVAQASGFVPVEGGYRLLDGICQVGPLITDGDLGVGRSRAELKDSAAEAANEFAEVWELILALLWSSSDRGSTDSMLVDARALGIELDDADPTTADVNLDDSDEALRFKFRRAAHLHAQVVRASEKAQRLARQDREQAAARERRQQRWADYQAKQMREREVRRRVAKAEIRDLRADRYATPNIDKSSGDKGDDSWSL
ncbi:hypothetical protein [Microbacterium aurugineum]|uniref:hypothetical protein n=1 Tax=Microbacterium aurugineum TaxID=2851642 RepID=UPI0020BF60BA|nr:hypothetical protein [Microbacterium aurugineum]MCK8476921.1 hypothetical protein [Microbacterium aurugineum]